MISVVGLGGFFREGCGQGGWGMEGRQREGRLITCQGETLSQLVPHINIEHVESRRAGWSLVCGRDALDTRPRGNATPARS